MHSFCTFLLLCFSVTIINAQFYNNGGTVFISTGATVFSNYTVSNNNSGDITNNGVLQSTSSIVNFSGSTYTGNGTYYIGEDWINTSNYVTGTATLVFTGNKESSMFSGGANIYNVDLQKTNDAKVTLAFNARVTNNLSFNTSSNKLLPHTYNLNLGPAATINNFDTDNYIVTDSTGKVVKEQLSGNFVFPVGNDPSSYNPIIINQSGVTDDLSVRVLPTVYENGASGPAFADDAVAATWEVEEALEGGSDLTLTTQWVASDELGSFDRSNSSIHHFEGSWTPSSFGPATGISEFTQIRAGITELGLFAVGGPGLEGGVVLDLHIMLQGPYAGAEMMNDNLRSLPDFPTTEPYTDLGFTHHFRGGGEMIDPSLLNSAPIVDWIFIQLHDPVDLNTVVASRSAILLANGRIVDLDGASDLVFDGVPSGNYFVSIDHRNHLGVMTATEYPLSRTTSLIDFTAGGPLHGGTNSEVQKDLGVGVFGLFGGDLDVSTNIDASDRSKAWNNRNTTGYLTADATMDGTCDAEERSQTWNNRNKSSFIP